MLNLRSEYGLVLIDSLTKVINKDPEIMQRNDKNI